MIAVLAIVGGLIVAAALDNRLGWGTLISVSLAVYCHRLYRQPGSASTPQGLPAPAPEDDELRPGWAVRCRREPAAKLPARISRQEPSGTGRG